MGCKNLKHHLMLILLIQLFLWVTFVNGQFIPGPRSANVGGRNQDLIFIIGGDVEFSKVYQLDTKTNNVTLPTILGVIPNRDSLVFMSSVSYEGKIYLFGGGKIETDIITLYNNHYIFNTINLNWEDGSLVGAPPPRYKHTATLVNEIIYYIGGIQINNSIISYPSMSDVRKIIDN
ncbi:hypothetical protein RhiirB3_456801 [Rhizophagus irregularis]|nr:hypothetical protein RhiirB3_456801 [Rhizophagus irregularis]